MAGEGSTAALPAADGAFGSSALESRERPFRVGNREIDRWGNVAYILPVPDSQLASPSGDFSDEAAVASAEAPLPLADTFFLHSYPSATKTIYLDFDGHVTTGTHWNTVYNSGNPIVTPAFSLDTDSRFSDTELQRIQAIWQRVAEDFRPFAVNVTTQDPGAAALQKSGAGDTAWGIRAVIGGSSTDWFSTSSFGGVAYLNSFPWNSDTPAFVFENNLNNGQEKSVAEAISHEIGHTLGLSHDGTTTGVEYYPGHGSGATGWAPIMGNGYSKELTQWSKGEYTGANRAEDDLAIIITANGFGYRPDDHGNNQASATVLHPTGGTILAGEGIIEQNTDRDYFALTTGSGPVSLTITPFARGPNLDILATLYDRSANVIATSNPTDRLDASFSINLIADTYYLAIEGTGKEPMTTGYSNYGSLGYYSIVGTVSPVDIRNVGVTVSPTSGLVTTEAGGTATFTIALDAAPLANVTIGLASSDSSEGLVSPADLTFTPANWSEPQTVTITGVDDAVADGDAGYIIITAAAISDDEAYHGLDPDDVSVTNLDDDWPEVLAGQHTLLPNTPNQTIAVYVAGGFPVRGLKFFAEIAGGDPASGGSLQGPQIQSVDLVGDTAIPTIFTGNNDGQHQAGGGLPQVQAWEISTAAGSVTAQGLLATLSIDTTGFWKEPTAVHGWPLLLADTQIESTHFLSVNGTRVNAAIVAGTITLNTPPIALASDVTTAEDTPYTFAVADIGFSDADTGDGLTALQIVSLPAAGTLEFDGVPVPEDQEILTADLTAGRLQFRPAADAYGSPYAAFEFAVHDGMGYSNSSAAITIHVTPVNDPPTVDDQWISVLENESTTLTLTGFDVDGDDLEFVIVDAPMHGILTGTAPNLEYTPLADFRGADSFTFIGRDGWLDSPPATVTIFVSPASVVVGRYVLYNDSAWDANDAAANANDDAAIAPDKQALLPGQVAEFQHYTSYVRGLNGLMIDIAHLGPDTVLSAADFQFLVGNSNDLAAWTAGPIPSEIALRPGDGVDGSTRVTLIWADPDVVRNRWLQVTVKATANTKLPQDDVFYFGNAIGESELGNTNGSQSLGYFPVNVTDEIAARNHPHSSADPALLDDAFDFNRDGFVDATDELIARGHGTTFRTALRSIAPAATSSEVSPTTVPGGSGWLFIVVGTHLLQPNQAGQEIPIYISGETPVAGLNFNIQVGDGELLSGGGLSAPAIEKVDILTRTIFAANHTGLRAASYGDVNLIPQHEYQATTTESGTVLAGGLLATVTIDTTGFQRGSWSLVMSSTVNGPTDFAGLGATIIDGSIALSLDWRNPVNPYDVDDNGHVSPLDALIVICYLNSLSGGSELPAMQESPPRYYDVNGDGGCTAADVLLLVNFINAQEAKRAGEGEAELSAEGTAASVAGRTAGAPPVDQRLYRCKAGTARGIRKHGTRRKPARGAGFGMSADESAHRRIHKVIAPLPGRPDARLGRMGSRSGRDRGGRRGGPIRRRFAVRLDFSQRPGGRSTVCLG